MTSKPLIPKEIKNKKQWSYSYSKDELKRPTHTNYEPNGALTLAQARAKAGKTKYMGFYVTKEDPYVLLDLDNIENPNNPFAELPVPLAALLQEHNTYSETSPSGKGVRVIYKLASKEDKKKVKGSIFYLRDAEPGKERDAQINFAQPWMTITLNATPYAIDEVSVMSLELLDEIFNIRYERVGERLPTLEREAKRAEDKVKKAIPSFAEVVTVMTALPLDQNPRIKRAYETIFRHKYQHYDYWLRVLMALHNYGDLSNTLVQALDLAVMWSASDKEGFKSEEDIAGHWRSFTEKEEIVSYKTIFGLYYGCTLRWPIPRKQSKTEIEHGSPKLPLNSEYKNFRALIDFYDIKLYRDEVDSNLLYLSGDQDIIKKYLTVFRVRPHYDKYYGPYAQDTLVPAFHIMCQDLGFTGIAHGTLSSFVANLLAETRATINMVRIYFDTPFHELPESYRENEDTYQTTTLDDLFKCMAIEYQNPPEMQDKELALYKKYYKAWWMGLVRNLYFRDDIHTNNCVLLLTGREQIRKTSHFKYLLPSFLREYVAFTTHGFSTETSVRDVCKLSASNLMIVWDEIEQYLNTETEPNFKKIIDNNDQKVIDKYQVVPMVIRPVAIYGATSNAREFKLGDGGSRRLFHIPVSWVDTDKIMKVNWHKLVNDLKTEVIHALNTNQIPWLLEEDELDFQSGLHKKLRAANAIDIALNEMFESQLELAPVYTVLPGVKSAQGHDEHMMTTKMVVDLLLRYGMSPQNLNRAAVVKALQRLCGGYTRTRRLPKSIDNPRCTITKGQACQAGKHFRWVMPPMRQHVMDSMFSMFTKE